MSNYTKLSQSMHLLALYRSSHFYYFMKSRMRHFLFFFFSSRRRHTRFKCDWSSDVCSSDLAPSPVDDPVTSAVLPERLKRSWTTLFSAGLQARTRAAELGLNVHHTVLPVFHFAMRRHGPQETDVVCGRGNIGMIGAGHQHCVALAHHRHQFGLVGIRIHELHAERRRRHFDIDVHLLEHLCVLVRWPTRPVARVGNGEARQHAAGLNILADQDVEVPRGRGSAGYELKRLVCPYFRVAHNLQGIVTLYLGRELRQVG